MLGIEKSVLGLISNAVFLSEIVETKPMEETSEVRIWNSQKDSVRRRGEGEPINQHLSSGWDRYHWQSSLN